VVTTAQATTERIGSPEYLRQARRAKLLSWASLAYMAVEGLVAIAAGVVAGSIALVGFGIDSAIEGFASVVIVWRFTGSRTLSHAAEDRAQKLVAIQFFLLAPYVAVESIRTLVDGSHPHQSIVGIILAASSLVVMPWLGRTKQRIGSRIGSSATASEGKQNFLCAYLAAALLVGLVGNALFGAWWLDPLVGLLIAAVAIQEGREAWRGDACCH
jgi:divalent metal cation (Fe/Co/Zn/Cd) transporter